ncbi:MAG TPA: NUDIX domain-containing protein [Candidatus Saccharimonadales bacterium]
MKKYENHTIIDDSDLQLDYFGSNLDQLTYSGYPSYEDRLRATDLALYRDENGRLVIPKDDRWTIDSHPNRPGSESSPSDEQQQMLASDGFELDSSGRPLHPWFWRMFSDPRIGVVTGRGFFRNWGPNYTADPIVIFEDQLLLILRADNDCWALPGGFINVHADGSLELPLLAALREAKEETGRVYTPEIVSSQEVYSGPIADIRSTANAWTETTAYLIEPEEMVEVTEPIDYSEVKDVGWFPTSTVADTHLSGSHRFLFQRALKLMVEKEDYL